jgi:hypothetical protein
VALGIIVLVIGSVAIGVVALLLFGRRRRGASSLGALATEPAPTLPVGRTSMARTAPSEEAGLPRWLRASVRADRAWTPPREPTLRNTRRQALTFDEPLGESAFRLVVRYDHVEVFDEPNDAYARTLAEVGTGDEVEIVELAETWAFVRTPHGVTGWLPTMTIGAAPFAPGPLEAPALSEALDTPAPAPAVGRSRRRSRPARPSA